MSEMLSESMALLATIDPQDITTTTPTSDYVDMSKFDRVVAIVAAGAILGTINAKLQQAQDGSGTGVKDITGKAITALTATDDNKQALINCRADELDLANDFDFIRLSVTGGAGGANLAYGAIWAGVARYGPASDNDLASVAEIVS